MKTLESTYRVNSLNLKGSLFKGNRTILRKSQVRVYFLGFWKSGRPLGLEKSEKKRERQAIFEMPV